MIVGLTGGIGSGKSTVANMFKDLGVPIINADAISRHIIDTDAEVLQKIINKFGQQYLTAEQTLDRRKLKKIIFSDPSSRIWLEQVLHPIITKEIARQAANTSTPYCVVEIPLLIEANLQDTVDRILTVDCSEDLQLQRAMQRDQHSATEIKNIIATQITRKQRLAIDTDIIENTSDLTDLKEQVCKLHNLYLQQSML